MTIHYDSKTDLLYLMIENSNTGEVINKRVSDEIVLDIGENDKIIGIEIMDASRHVNLGKLMPIEYQSTL
ncbi:MAG TPA: DUF2283 domain-containing protein [Hanamia sp.]|nr:DUF2283 domain-containing protein [Hanamia sp.]